MTDPAKPPPAEPAAKPPKRSRRTLWAIGALAAVAALLALFTWTVLSFTYASGERVGYIQKFSRKGWVCKTWEGELTMQVLPGVLPEKFYFSTGNPLIAAEVNKNLGKLVRLKYAQHKFVPTCFGETEYFVSQVQLIE